MAKLEGNHLGALLNGAPLGLPCRQRGMFHDRQHDTQQLALLRGLWRIHRETVIAIFQQSYPGLMPWAYWRFEATGPRDDAAYEAAYRRHAQEITARMTADSAARQAAGQSVKDRRADFTALAHCPKEQRDQLRQEQYARLGIPNDTPASTPPAE